MKSIVESSTNSNGNTRQEWIDCLKFLAILAVITDHTYGLLYSNIHLAYVSYFSVTLFIWLSGMTAFMTAHKHENELYYKDTGKKLTKILGPYAIASTFYVLVSERTVNLSNFIVRLVNFSISAHFYFILVYCQLILISKFLYKIVIKTMKRKKPVLCYSIELIISMILSALFIQYTYVLPVHGGGQYLFGGTYLVVYFAGMIFAALYRKIKWNKINSLLTFVLSIIGTCFWLLFIIKNNFEIDTALKYFGIINPPGFTLIIYTILILILGWSFNEFIELYNIKILLGIRKIIANLGQHTLYIFFYHIILIIIVNNNLYMLKNIWIKKAIYLIIAVGGSLLIEIVIKQIKVILSKINS